MGGVSELGTGGAGDPLEHGGAAGAAGLGGAGGAGGAPVVLATGESLRVTEIMFNPRSSPELEWIELCNIAAAPVDLTGYTLWDDDNASAIAPNFPEGARVPANACVVVTGEGDVSALQVAWGMSVAALGIVRFPALTNSGDRVQLWDAEHRPLEADVEAGVHALVSFDYPGSVGDGAGSIQLISLSADPNDPESWVLSVPGATTTETAAGDIGSPGQAP